MGNLLQRALGQSFTDYLDAVLDHLLAGLRERGHDPQRVALTINVTGRTDDEIDLMRRRAAERGLSHLQLVDDRAPARPGTAPSSMLGPAAHASMRAARAARILAGK